MEQNNTTQAAQNLCEAISGLEGFNAYQEKALKGLADLAEICARDLAFSEEHTAILTALSEYAFILGEIKPIIEAADARSN